MKCAPQRTACFAGIQGDPSALTLLETNITVEMMVSATVCNTVLWHFNNERFIFICIFTLPTRDDSYVYWNPMKPYIYPFLSIIHILSTGEMTGKTGWLGLVY